jgi:hypothetical protein
MDIETELKAKAAQELVKTVAAEVGVEDPPPEEAEKILAENECKSRQA